MTLPTRCPICDTPALPFNGYMVCPKRHSAPHHIHLPGITIYWDLVYHPKTGEHYVCSWGEAVAASQHQPIQDHEEDEYGACF